MLLCTGGVLLCFDQCHKLAGLHIQRNGDAPYGFGIWLLGSVFDYGQVASGNPGESAEQFLCHRFFLRHLRITMPTFSFENCILHHFSPVGYRIINKEASVIIDKQSSMCYGLIYQAGWLLLWIKRCSERWIQFRLGGCFFTLFQWPEPGLR